MKTFEPKLAFPILLVAVAAAFAAVQNENMRKKTWTANTDAESTGHKTRHAFRRSAAEGVGNGDIDRLPEDFKLKKIEQKLDHQNDSSLTFQQIYYHYSYCGEKLVNPPIFIYVGGAEAMTRESMDNKDFWTIACGFRADIYFLEHRFYGKSQPFENLTFDSVTATPPKQGEEEEDSQSRKRRYIPEYDDVTFLDTDQNEGESETSDESSESEPNEEKLVLSSQNLFFRKANDDGEDCENPEECPSPPGAEGRRKLKFLSAYQAIKDIEAFAEEIIEKRNDDRSLKSTVVLFGHSYGGSLAAWAKSMDSNELFQGAVVWSAPIRRQFTVPSFSRHAVSALKASFPPCYEAFDTLLRVVNEKVEQSSKEESGSWLNFTLMNLSDASTLTGLQAEFAADVLRILSLQAVPGYESGTAQFCRDLIKGILGRFRKGQAQKFINKYTAIVKKFNKSSVTMKEKHWRSILRSQPILAPPPQKLEKTVKPEDEVPLNWLFTWQRCNELGWFALDTTEADDFFQTSEVKANDEADKLCGSYFAINASVAEKNVDDIRFLDTFDESDASNIIAINGERDPWKSLMIAAQNEETFVKDDSLHILRHRTSQSVLAVCVKSGGHGEHILGNGEVSYFPYIIQAQFDTVWAEIEKWLRNA